MVMDNLLADQEGQNIRYVAYADDLAFASPIEDRTGEDFPSAN